MASHGDYEDEANIHPPHHGMSVTEYLTTRITTLKPPMTKAPNPIRLIRMLNRHQWTFFGVAFFAWVCMTFSLPPFLRDFRLSTFLEARC